MTAAWSECRIPGTKQGHSPLPVQTNTEFVYKKSDSISKLKFFKDTLRSRKKKNLFSNMKDAFVVSERERVWIFALILLLLLFWMWVEEIFSVSVAIDLFLPHIPCSRCPPVRLRGHLLLLKESDSAMANSSSRADDGPDGLTGARFQSNSFWFKKKVRQRMLTQYLWIIHHQIVPIFSC